MGFAKKLGDFARTANALFPAREYELTIAEDYPEKWPEIQRKRLINKGIWGAVGLFLVFLIIVRIWIGAVAINQWYQSVWPFAPIIGALVLVVLLYSTNQFECPRCGKTFRSYSRYDFLNDPKARCQHCNLQLGEPSDAKLMR